jgi:3-hydroxybutyryl-CoA dehydrogenase
MISSKRKVQKIAIIGAGMMASGIGVRCAMSGLNVKLVDIKKEAVQQSRMAARGILDRLIKISLLRTDEADRALSNISWTMDTADGVRACDLVIESTPEVLKLKQQVLKQLDELCSPEALLVTGTTSLRISDIASATNREQNVVGLHWVNPPYLLPRVEVNRGEKTSPESIRRAISFVLQIGQIPAITQRDVPGFVGARLRTVLVNEAISLVEQGIISVQDVDNMVRFGLAIQILPHGVLRSFDLTGPKSLTVTGGDYIYERTGEAKYRPPQLLREKAKDGELPWIAGEKKTTKGWYDYAGKSTEEILEGRDMRIASTVKVLEGLGIIDEERRRIMAGLDDEGH